MRPVVTRGWPRVGSLLHPRTARPDQSLVVPMGYAQRPSHPGPPPCLRTHPARLHHPELLDHPVSPAGKTQPWRQPPRPVQYLMRPRRLTPSAHAVPRSTDGPAARRHPHQRRRPSIDQLAWSVTCDCSHRPAAVTPQVRPQSGMPACAGSNSDRPTSATSCRPAGPRTIPGPGLTPRPWNEPPLSARPRAPGGPGPGGQESCHKSSPNRIRGDKPRVWHDYLLRLSNLTASQWRYRTIHPRRCCHNSAEGEKATGGDPTIRVTASRFW